MAEPLKLFVLAGEPSGDRIAADLVEGIRRHAEVELAGVGGSELEAAGLNSLFPMDDLSVMGWVDVLPHLPRLFGRARQAAEAIAAMRPDVVVLVDAQVFSKGVAKRARALAPDIPILLYVAPSVWAWKPKRAPALMPLFDEVLAVLPFEPEVMQRLGGPPTSYVGHPSLASIPFRGQRPKSGPLLLLPGSRKGELRRHLPLMREVAERFARHRAVTRLTLPTLPRLHEQLIAHARDWAIPVEVVSDRGLRMAAFAEAVAAVAVSGTVTLELAMAGIPTVATYVADPGQGVAWLRYSIKYATLPNAILDQPLIPEILGVRADAKAVSAALATLLDDGQADRQVEGFRRMRSLMKNGTLAAPRVDPAMRVLSHVPRYRDAIGT